MAEFKPQYNYKPIDLNRFLGGNDFGFPVDGKPGYNGDIFPKYVGSMSEKNYADMAKNDDIRNKDADYIIGGRLYEAVVDVFGRGDYKTIQEAISAGKKKIFLRNGTYIIKSSLDIASDTSIVGEDKYNTIIDIQDRAQIKTSGSLKYNTGTIGATNGDATVTGSGTTFVGNIAVGDFIRLGIDFYEVELITDNTHLEIKNAYNGRTFSGQSTFVLEFVKNITLSNLTIKCDETPSSELSNIYLLYLAYSFIDNLIVIGRESTYTICMNLYGLESCQISNIYVSGTGRDGIFLGYANNNNFSNIQINNQSQYGFAFVTNCFYNKINNVAVNGTKNGIFIAGGNDNNRFNNIQASDNLWYGVSIAGNLNVLTNLSITNNGQHGIIVTGDYNCIANSIFQNNGQTTNDTYSDIIFSNADHNKVASNQMIATASNKVKYGILESGTSDYNIITGNDVVGAVTASISTSGANTVSANNIP